MFRCEDVQKMDWLEPLFESLKNSNKNIALVVDRNSVVTPTALADTADYLGSSIVHFGDYPLFRCNYSPPRSAINSRIHMPVHDVKIFQKNT